MNASSPAKDLISLMFSTVKNLLTLPWKTIKIPTLQDWLLKLWDPFIYDKISLTILQSENLSVPAIFQEKWFPLLEAASSGHLDSFPYQHHKYYVIFFLT